MNASSGEGVKGSLQTEIAKKQEILNQLPSLKDEGILYAETAELRSYKLRTEISGLEAQITQLPPENLEAITQAVSLYQFSKCPLHIEHRLANPIE